MVKEYLAFYEHMIHFDTLLQNVTDIITKCDSYFITKCDRNFLQNVSSFLLQNTTILLQNAIFIIKCDVYYKMRRLLQIATIQLFKIPCLLLIHSRRNFEYYFKNKQIYFNFLWRYCCRTSPSWWRIIRLNDNILY